jgi:hypothetical protein
MNVTDNWTLLKIQIFCNVTVLHSHTPRIFMGGGGGGGGGPPRHVLFMFDFKNYVIKIMS